MDKDIQRILYYRTRIEQKRGCLKTEIASFLCPAWAMTIGSKSRTHLGVYEVLAKGKSVVGDSESEGSR